MKQTAVEWLAEQMMHPEIHNPYIEQAKEMEKEQIMDAHYYGKINGMDISHPLSMYKEESAEQYYNETFKKL